MRRLFLFVAILAASIGPLKAFAEVATAGLPRESELAREPSWMRPSRAEVRDRALAWAADTAAANTSTAGMLDRVATVWEPATEKARGTPAEDLLDEVMETLAIVDPRAATVLGTADHPGILAGPGSLMVDAAWLDDPATAPFERDSVRLWLGRQLVRQDRFDEALPLLADLDVAASVDPATLLFHRGCCEHWLLAREGAAESFDRLLEREAEIPLRYARLARLLRADIAGLELDSLDHIARRMRDVRRRLDLGFAGPATRRVQQGVVESLDKLIEEIEDQQQQGQSGAAGPGEAGEGEASGRPMDDSRIAGGRGPGEVQKRDLGSAEGWGNLPAHDRESALQQIGREYPSHYREAIEQYFKRLATGEDRAP